MVFISANGNTSGEYFTMQPKLGSSAPQTVKFKVDQLTPLEGQTLTFAFPPGSGTVVLLGVELSGGQGDQQ